MKNLRTTGLVSWDNDAGKSRGPPSLRGGLFYANSQASTKGPTLLVTQVRILRIDFEPLSSPV